MRATSLRAVFVATVIVAAASSAAAQTPVTEAPVTLAFHDGLVTLHAANAPTSMILTEWARVGGTAVTNAERVVGPGLTIDLENVPEQRVLDIVLRGVAGFVLTRRDPASRGASAFGQLLVLPTSSVPRATALQAAASTPPRTPEHIPAFLQAQFAEKGAEGRRPQFHDLTDATRAAIRNGERPNAPPAPAAPPIVQTEEAK